ncbi:hypothetical protein Cgig2_023126 [Carnegiea gigantea]|uniref:Uncharacterized protein n=1 Tax=Carnegiea gigantea TaxID=171969 RepID=A0A9Q1JRU8_9CARY|nr:hypothetical protein Cgig2_023126 [Carnegiea gigantea]
MNDIKEHLKSSHAEICGQKSKYMLPIGVCEPSTKKLIERPPTVTESIMDILDAEPDPTECMGESNGVNFKEELGYIHLSSRSHGLRLDSWQGSYSPNSGEAESSPKAHVASLRASQEGVFIFNADAVIKEVDKNASWVFNQSILDKMSDTPYNGLYCPKGKHATLRSYRRATPVKQLLKSQIVVVQGYKVESRCEELLKELQLLEDQKKNLNSQLASSKHLLQETE